MPIDLVEETVRLGRRELVIARPRRPEDLIDEHEFAEDEFLPYWAELWPSSLALARVVADADVAGRKVMELGCGLGVPSIVAALGGARVLATDWSAEAVRAVRANAQRNHADLDTAVWRWSDDERELGGPFDLVLGSDLLYERRNGPWLWAALPRVTAPEGEVWLADPGRAAAEDFFTEASADFAVDELAHGGPPGVVVRRLSPRGGRAGSRPSR